MNRKVNQSLLVICVLLSFVSCKNRTQADNEKVEAVFEETWESLATVDREPEWFKDAKFGIYFHWGLYSVPAFDNEWYPRWMYVPGRENWGGAVFEHHKNTFGPVSEFNYHDFIPMFTAEHFDAAEWADLFKKSGAR
ncbi:MAG: alpha-L-fucosidase, partial [Prolixibacteraceae bacterium]|nr:alpha-L-fucosidase [Prolixibacteraceae bacterium]